MIALPKKDEELVILRFLWSKIAEHYKWLILSFVFASGAALVQVKAADLVQHIMDDAIIPKDWGRLVGFCWVIVGLFLFDGFTDFCHRLCLRIAVERTIRRVRREIFERFLMLSSDQSAKSTSGQAVTHVLSDTFVVGQGLHVVADLMREPIILIALLSRLVYMNWQLTIICFVGLPIIFGMGRKLGKSARRNQGSIQVTLDGITNHINETLRGLRTAHAFGQTPKLRHEFEEQTQESYKYLVKLATIEETVSPLTKWLTSWVGAGLLLLCGWMVIHGRMTAGQVLSFVTAAGFLQQPIRQLNQVSVRLQTVVASGKRIYDLLNAPLDEIGRSQKIVLEQGLREVPTELQRKATPTLEFRDVSYRYPTAGPERELALRGVNLIVKPGMRVALVGKSGSGKTTLSLLAMRFLDPTQGQVVMDGKISSDWDMADYRSHFGYVSQDVFLFNRTVRENLLFAQPRASDAEIWTALERASIREFVEKLPARLDTNLNEHASNLSGGEKQRLAIARAFLRDAPFLILDEATSQLDSLSEQAVQGALYKLMEKRSVLVIAHRLSTIREVDEVAVFADGSIIEQGRPEVLLENPAGPFAKLWAAQSGNKSGLIA